MRVAGHCVGQKEEEASKLVCGGRHTDKLREEDLGPRTYSHTLLGDIGFATTRELRRECYTKVTGEEESMLSELLLDQTNLFRYSYELCEESLLE